MRHLNPYAEIEKVPLFTGDNMKSKGYSIRIEDEEADAGWNEVGIVSSDYLLVPNRQVRDMAREITGRTAMEWSEDKVFFDGKRFVYGLVAEPGEVQADVEVGDVLNLGMLFENSYDGSRKLAVSLYAHRLACTNGLLMPQYFARMRFKHDNQARRWEDEVSRALSIVGHAETNLRRFADAAGTLAQHPVGSAELQTIREGVLDRVPITLWGKMLDRYLMHEDHTGWGLLNAGTNLVWHSERPTISDFVHNEHITSSLIEYATDRLGHVSLSTN